MILLDQSLNYNKPTAESFVQLCWKNSGMPEPEDSLLYSASSMWVWSYFWAFKLARRLQSESFTSAESEYSLHS